MLSNYHVSPVKGGGSEAIALSQQELVVQKWSILWRSIIASSLEETLFPYCKYIRVLDLRDLSNLLEDDKFKANIAKNFFSGKLSRFYIVLNTPSSKVATKPVHRAARLDVTSIIDAVGEAITPHSCMLEQISGDVLPTALPRWVTRLPRLRSLELWDGRSLAEENLQELIARHCPNFDAFSLYMWSGEGQDHRFSTFISGLRPQSLQFFQVFRDAHIGVETCLALNDHGRSLKTIKLNLRSEALPNLALLKGCTAVETLHLEDMDGTADLHKTHNDAFLEIVDWLKQCSNLQDFSLTNFVGAADIGTPVLVEYSIRLRKLNLGSYMVKDNQTFHAALIQQPLLETLSLQGEPDEMTFDDNEILIQSLGQLKELRELELRGVSDYFSNKHIIHLAEQLKKLEDLYVSGYGITDVVWDSLAGLENLRNICINAWTAFTADGLLKFIEKLRPSNQGIVISIYNADPDSLLSEEEQAMVREVLATKVGGRLDYTPWRDPDVSEFEGESD
ncbi:hypothetical protein H2201_005545 [Coniosporium apollinis]|uniref:F-box domain-containing protein n=1 Tax=Coniosporium apollinis TaxID=61459 RepID=A0ABQ9NPL5_9PEZI|nr:hypothetical protein H2201_005545 [Coniosporium apollinis]